VLTYLGPYVTDQPTGQISFAELHMDLCRAIGEMAAPGPVRHAFVGPRRGGKSIYRGIVAPTFLLAHGHRRFYQAFGATDYTARGHLSDLLDLLHGRHECSALLLADFPELAPVRGAGGPGRTVLAGGAIVAARGLGAETKGEVYAGARPDLLVGDDLTKGSQITPDLVAKAKAQLRDDVLPMNDEAAVLLVGTVFQRGDLMDDVVRTALRERCQGADHGQWLQAERFVCHYHPVDWPQRWPAEVLARERAADLHRYALRYEPHLLDQVGSERRFTPELWCRDRRFPTVRRIISVDHAVERGVKNDMTAIAVLGVDAAGRDRLGRGRVVVERVEVGHWDLPEINDRIHDLCELPGQRVRPDLVLWERNQGGRLLSDQLIPPACCTTKWTSRDGRTSGVGLWPWRAEARKAARIEALHAQVKRRAVWLAGEVPVLEVQAEAWTPKATRDDALDAVAAGERYLRTGDPSM
jgi:hypothetical protein